MIIVNNSSPRISELALARFAARARRELRLGKVQVLLTNDLEVRRLNRTFRKKNKSTDVLSFPALERLRSAMAGDVAISVEYAARSARRFGLTLQDELKILILHGMIHLSGHDHESDRGEMARLESRLRKKLGLPAGLIARAESENTNRASTLKVAALRRRRSTISSRTSAQPRGPRGGVRR